MKLLVIDELDKCNDKYDTLDILIVYERMIRTNRSKKYPKWMNAISTNYKTTRGDYCTGFGTLDFDVDEISNLLREAKIKELID